MTRFNAAGIHFLISVFFIFAFFLYAYNIWYDQIYFDISGAIAPSKILILVDVILGPLLTLLVYKKGKKSLKFDLSIIALMQFAAFSYGAYTLYIGKPSLVVMKKNAFEIIIQKNIDASTLNPELNNFSNIFNRPIYGHIPEESLDVFSSAYSQQSKIDSISIVDTRILDKKMTIDSVLKLLKFENVNTFENSLPGDIENYIFYLINDGDWYAVLVVSADSGIPHTIFRAAKGQ